MPIPIKYDLIYLMKGDRMNHQILYCLEDYPLCLFKNPLKRKELNEIVVVNYVQESHFKNWNHHDIFYENGIKVVYYEVIISKAKKLFNQKQTYQNIEKYCIEFLKILLEKNE